MKRFSIERQCPQRPDRKVSPDKFPFLAYVIWPPEPAKTAQCDSPLMYRLSEKSAAKARKHFEIRYGSGDFVCQHMGKLV